MRTSLSLIVMCALAVGGIFIGGAGAHSNRRVETSRTLYFYSNLGALVPGPTYAPNTPLIRPSGLLIFQDGSYVIEKLIWKNWGSSVAQATGISSSSTCKPNCATAPRINKPADVTVSQPRLLFGREVYTCYQLTVPSYPASDQADCLKPSPGNGYAYAPVVAKSAPPTTSTGFRTTLPGAVSCQMSVSPTFTQVFCQALMPHDQAAQAHGATLKATGDYTTCGGDCVGNPGQDTPTWSVGKTATVGPFTCTVEPDGVECVVTKTHKGFVFNEHTVHAFP